MKPPANDQKATGAVGNLVKTVNEGLHILN